MKLFFKHDFLKIITVISFFILLMTATFATLAESKHEGDEHEGEEHKEQGEHEGEEGHIALTPEQLKNANIQLAKVSSATIRETLPLYGVVALNSEKVQNISARFPGIIRSIARKVGDKVKVGDTLAVIESNESLKNYTLTATSNGVITERLANEGEQTAERTLFVIADLSSVWVELAVFPRDMGKVKIGQSVHVHQAQIGLTSVGKLIYLSPSANSANQTLTARVLLANAEQEWVTGLFVSAEVTLAQTSVTLAVKNEALQTLENNTVVFVQGEEGFEPRPVRLGKADSEYTEVLEGLSLDETYVAHNSFILKSDLGKEGAEHED